MAAVRNAFREATVGLSKDLETRCGSNFDGDHDDSVVQTALIVASHYDELHETRERIHKCLGTPKRIIQLTFWVLLAGLSEMIDLLLLESSIQADAVSECLRLYLNEYRGELKNYDKNTTLLIFAVRNGLKNLVSELIQRGAVIDELDEIRGWSALHYAAEGCNTETTKLLLDHGANLEVQSGESRETPLHVACNSFQKANILLFAEKGADFSKRDYDDQTCFQCLLATISDRDVSDTFLNNLCTKLFGAVCTDTEWGVNDVRIDVRRSRFAQVGNFVAIFLSSSAASIKELELLLETVSPCNVLVKWSRVVILKFPPNRDEDQMCSFRIRIVHGAGLLGFWISQGFRRYFKPAFYEVNMAVKQGCNATWCSDQGDKEILLATDSGPEEVL